MWGPSDWKNPHIKMSSEPFVDLFDAHIRDLNNKRYVAFEAGADAMLKALKKEPRHLIDCPFDGYDDLGRKGSLVFIPEGKDKECYPNAD